MQEARVHKDAARGRPTVTRAPRPPSEPTHGPPPRASRPSTPHRARTHWQFYVTFGEVLLCETRSWGGGREPSQGPRGESSCDPSNHPRIALLMVPVNRECSPLYHQIHCAVPTPMPWGFSSQPSFSPLEYLYGTLANMNVILGFLLFRTKSSISHRAL